ncbi:MAG TPA: VapE family protein [Saprospiraceae bacterium]|nr:VapE family protein [Saprospiraceae bacterium]HMP24322.1 VapE family protein [Saprospiraceae bacterium]
MTKATNSPSIFEGKNTTKNGTNQANGKKFVQIPAGIDANQPANGKKRESKAEARIQQLEKALTAWEFRFNAVTCCTEVKQGGAWARMDDFTLNSIVRQLRSDGVSLANKTRVAELLESDFCKVVNPIEEYFSSLQQPSGDPIGELCATVTPVAGGEMLRKFFQKWLVGAVANVFIKDRCANQLCFILSGRQGVFKSTWIRNLCPQQLSAYYIEGSLDPEDKDSMSATATNFIYNLDDYFAGITQRKINEFKGLLTKNTVKIRRPYARYSEEMPKICSFIASSNEDTFLHDPTGNRRFLPFEVEAIDIAAADGIDIEAVWAQAFHLFKSGYQYWLTKDEQDELNQYNEQFEVQSSEYEALVTFYQLPGEGENGQDVYQLTNAELQKKLEGKSHLKLSKKKLGEALKKAGFIREQVRRNKLRTWVYKVVELHEADVVPLRQVGRGAGENII